MPIYSFQQKLPTETSNQSLLEKYGWDTSNQPSEPGQFPEFGALPTYTAPEWDEGKISSLTQKVAAPGLRNLRQQVQRASSQPSTNPNVKAMTLRDALAGYGQGLENIMGGARSSAGQEYAREYGTKQDEAKTNYESATKKKFAEYQALYGDYMAKMARGSSSSSQQTSGSNYGGGYTGQDRRSASPSGVTSSKATPSQVDLMSFLGGDAGFESSRFIPQSSPEWNLGEEPKEQPQEYGYPDWETDYIKQYGQL